MTGKNLLEVRMSEAARSEAMGQRVAFGEEDGRRGGGFIIVPGLIFVTGIPIHRAITTLS